MQENKTSNLNLSLIWFGAAVSIAEIATGVLLAPLGLAKGITAVLIGHLIGGIILILAGLIGAKSCLSSIQSTRISFGRYGSYFFSILNILQLLGWTAIMIINGAVAINAITIRFGIDSFPLWCVLIGALIILWIIIGIKNLSKVNIVAMTALFIFCAILGWKAFSSGTLDHESFGTITFGAAVELSVAMPLSWLPLIADYTREAKKPVSGTMFSSLAYFVGSCFMYIIGLGAAIFAGTSDISQILLASGMGVIALLIIVLSTVTTTFLDAYSAGVSAANLSPKIKEKHAAILTTVLGTIMAIFISMSQYENFLYLIGSVFAPLFAILFTDYFLFKKEQIDEHCKMNIKNIVLWVIGFIGYRWFMTIDFALGNTLPVMVAISLLCVICHYGEKLCFKKR